MESKDNIKSYSPKTKVPLNDFIVVYNGCNILLYIISSCLYETHFKYIVSLHTGTTTSIHTGSSSLNAGRLNKDWNDNSR